MSDFAIICLGAATAVNSITLAALLAKFRARVVVGSNGPELMPRVYAETAVVPDQLARFLSDCTVVEPGRAVRSEALYETYLAWCQRSGEAPWQMRGLHSAMQAAGFRKYVQGCIWWDGIRLKEVG